MINLEGRLEKARITSSNKLGSLSFGFLTDSEYEDTIAISGLNGFLNKYLGFEVIIRFDHNSRIKSEEKQPLASFISKDIPPNFRGLSNEQFILYGIWENNWKSDEYEIPSIKEVNSYYNPGRSGRIIYLSNNDLKLGYRNFFIFPNNHPVGLNKNINDILNNGLLKINNNHPRVFLVESKIDEELLISGIHKLGLFPIKMTPIAQKLYVK